MTSVTPPAREGRDSCWAQSKGCAKVSAGGNPRLAPCARSLPSDTRFIILISANSQPGESPPAPQPAPSAEARNHFRNSRRAMVTVSPSPRSCRNLSNCRAAPAAAASPALDISSCSAFDASKLRDGQSPYVFVQITRTKLTLGHQRGYSFTKGVAVDDGQQVVSLIHVFTCQPIQSVYPLWHRLQQAKRQLAGLMCCTAPAMAYRQGLSTSQFVRIVLP